MKTVTSRTRAPRQGKLVYCPHCGAQARFFHFSWSAAGCQSCSAMVKKLQWLLENPEIKDYERNFIVLVNDRKWDDLIYKFNEHLAVTYGYVLDWVDSSGQRSVHVFRPFKSNNEEQIDLPHWAFEEFQAWFQQRHGKTPQEAGMKLLRRMEDPGLGIIFPEDIKMLEKIKSTQKDL